MARRVGKKRARQAPLDALQLAMPEADLQTAVVRLANEAGWLHHELTDWIYALARFRMKQAPRKGKRWPKPGWPDMFLVQPWDDPTEPARCIVMELKSESGALRDAQKEFLRSFDRIPGIETYVIRPRDYYDGTVEHILTKGPVEHERTAKEIWRPFSKKYKPSYGIEMPVEDEE